MENKKIENLISAVKEFPVLYQKDQPSITIDQKNAIWAEISERIQQPVSYCKNKWRNLRDSHLKAMKWKRELEQIGKLSSYHSYKHEDKLSFLNQSRKRILPEEKNVTSKKVKKESTIETYTEEYTQEEVDFIEEETFPENISKVNEEFVHHQQHDLNESSLNLEESSYTAQVNNGHVNELEAWATDVKETLLSFPKLLRAKARKQINEIVSEYEILYLESLEAERGIETG